MMNLLSSLSSGARTPSAPDPRRQEDGAHATGPGLTRRGALLGAAALLAPLGAPLPAAARAAPLTGLPILLNGNENPYGPSAAARQAILASAGDAPRYADGAMEKLRNQLADHEGIPAAQLVLGSGSGELLRIAGLLASSRAPGSEIIAARPTYEELPDFAERLGLKVRWIAPDAMHRHDLPAMRAAVGSATSLVYICNPNNPTGTAVRSDALAAFLRSLPTTVIAVVDEAYIDFVDARDVASVAPLVRQLPNLLVLRTFSKLHGLAGLRVGYGMVSEPLAKSVADWMLVWPNSTGLAAASASLADVRFQQSTRAAILADRQRVHAALDRLGRPHTESQGNFVFFDTGAPIKQFQERMQARGLIVGRRFSGYDTWARVTIGQRNEVDRFLAALPQALGA